MFNECRSSLKIYSECTGREQDLLDVSFRHNSPNYDLHSQLNPFVLHGDNLCIALVQHGISSEDLIGLQNNSRNCIKYEWDDVKLAASSCEICVEPKRGYLKPGFTKLFRVTAKSLGSRMMMQMIPVKCSIFRYHKENLREYSLPDGYFEYTEKGFYEKVNFKKLRICFTLIELYTHGKYCKWERLRVMTFDLRCRIALHNNPNQITIYDSDIKKLFGCACCNASSYCQLQTAIKLVSKLLGVPAISVYECKHQSIEHPGEH